VVHFLSDLHLTPHAPGITRIFLDYLGNNARSAERVFILGDLFEAWPGDDAIDDPDDRFDRDIIERLRALTESGTRVAFQHGNRDFLLGRHFSERTGVTLLPDPFLLSLPSRQFVLSHGDALCTDDMEYQSFRKQVRSPDWKTAFLNKPLAERKAIAAAMRQQSETSKREKTTQTMDLNPSATDEFLRAHGYATMIHGHTHRPARHDHVVDGIRVERWVLADWHEDRGEYLAWDGHQLSRHVLA